MNINQLATHYAMYGLQENRKWFKMEDANKILDKFIKYITENVPFIYTKYGDGEYETLTKLGGENCDGGKYTNKLKIMMENSFKHLSDLSIAIRL